MRVLLAALCFTATEPPGFGSTERVMCVPAPSLCLYRQHVDFWQVGSLVAICAFFFSSILYSAVFLCVHARIHTKQALQTKIIISASAF